MVARANYFEKFEKMLGGVCVVRPIRRNGSRVVRPNLSFVLRAKRNTSEAKTDGGSGYFPPAHPQTDLVVG